MNVIMRKGVAKVVSNKDKDEIDDKIDSLTYVSDSVKKFLWVIVPVFLALAITFFSGPRMDIQVILYGVLILIAGFGIWTINARVRHKEHEKASVEWQNKLEKELDDLSHVVGDETDGLVKKTSDLSDTLNKVNDNLTDIKENLNRNDRSNRVLLRNRLIELHKEWYEDKGYITAAALKNAEDTYQAYQDTGGNSSGTKIWEDLSNLELKG